MRERAALDLPYFKGDPDQRALARGDMHAVQRDGDHGTEPRLVRPRRHLGLGGAREGSEDGVSGLGVRRGDRPRAAAMPGLAQRGGPEIEAQAPFAKGEIEVGVGERDVHAQARQALLDAREALHVDGELAGELAPGFFGVHRGTLAKLGAARAAHARGRVDTANVGRVVILRVGEQVQTAFARVQTLFAEVQTAFARVQTPSRRGPDPLVAGPGPCFCPRDPFAFRARARFSAA